MVENRSRRKNVRQELVAAVDGDADRRSRLRTGRVRNDKFRRVGALAADQRTGDVPRSCIERHSFRQRRGTGTRADGIGVGRDAATGCYGTARIRRALCPARTGSGCDCQRRAIVCRLHNRA